jgi:hypothetical protein
MKRKTISQRFMPLSSENRKASALKGDYCGSPLIKPRVSSRASSMSFQYVKASPLLKKLISDSESKCTQQKFKFGKSDVVNNDLYINKNAIKKKRKIEDEYKIDVSAYKPTKEMLKLRAMMKELDGLNVHNDRQIEKMRRLRRRNKIRSQQKVVVRKVINLNQTTPVQVEEVKEEKKGVSRKAALSISHGGPTKILRKASEFVDKSKLDAFLNMEIIFESLKMGKNKNGNMNQTKNNLFEKCKSVSIDKSPTKKSPVEDKRNFFNLITERVTKKVFLAKQKLKFLMKMVMTKKGKVIYEGENVDNITSLKRKIELFDEILRHVREKSLHRIHLKIIKSVFADDEETLGIADKLSEYQERFLSHLIKKKKNDEDEIVNIDSSYNKTASRFQYKGLIKKIVEGELVTKSFQMARMERAREFIRKRQHYNRSQMAKSVKTGRYNRENLNSGNVGFDGTSQSTLYDHANLTKRFCPPIKPNISFGFHKHLRFSQYAPKNNS